VEGGGGGAFSPLDGAVWARVTEKGHIVELYGLKKKGAMAGEVEGRGGGGGLSARQVEEAAGRSGRGRDSWCDNDPGTVSAHVTREQGKGGGSGYGRCGPRWFVARPVVWAGLNEQCPL
jgi:hypothetical protein